MPVFLTRLLARFSLLRNWATPLVVVVGVFVTSWPLMALAEPAGSELVRPGNYWWYFAVTASTVGYGDHYPSTVAGHVVGLYVIVGGIATLTTVFTKLASMFEQAKGRRMKGAITVSASGHVVLLGYTPGRTERIVGQLLAENGTGNGAGNGTEHGELVLCAWDEVGTHPMPEQHLTFVRGDLTDEEVLRRAGVHRAGTVLVDARDDNEALAIAVTVDHVNPDAHIVVALRDMERASLLHYVNAGARCVQWHTPRMISEELSSPGIAEVYTELMTHGGADTYSIELPKSTGPVLVEHCQTVLGREHGATLLAARSDGVLLVNPGWHITLTPGSVLYYISPRRLSTRELTQALRGQAAD